MASRFGGIPLEEEQVGSRFGGVPLEEEPVVEPIPERAPFVPGAERPPETTLPGTAAAITRGAGPYVAGAAIGAGLGAPVGGVGAVPGALAGMGAVAATKLIGDPIVDLTNRFLGTTYKRPSDAMEDFFTRLGVEEPDTEAEKFTQLVAEGATSAGGMVGMFKTLEQQASGPVAKEVYRQMAAQPGQQAAGGAGSVVGQEYAKEMGYGGFGQFIGSILGGISGAGIAGGTKQAITPESELSEIGKREGIHLTTSDLYKPESRMSSFLRSIGEFVPIVGTGKIRAKQVKQREAAVKEVMSEYGTMEPDDALTALTKSVRENRKTKITQLNATKDNIIDEISDPTLKLRTENIQNRIEAIDRQVQGMGESGAPMDTRVIDNLSAEKRALMDERESLFNEYAVDLTKTNKVIDDEIAELRNIPSKASDKIIKELQEWKSDLQGQDIKNVDRLRKRVSKRFEKENLADVKDEASQIVNRIYAPLREDIGNHIKKKSGEEAFKKWDKATKRLHDYISDLEMGAMKRLIKTGEVDPEVISTMLLTGSTSKAKKLFKNISPKDRPKARTAIMSDIVDKSIVDGELSPDKFARLLDKNRKRINVFFPGVDRKRLEGLKRVIHATKRSVPATERLKARAETTTILTTAGITGLVTTGGAKILAGLALSGGLVRAMESRPVRNLLIKIDSVEPGTREEAALMKRLVSTLQTYQEGIDEQD